jgi:predicted dehydrogenase
MNGLRVGVVGSSFGGVIHVPAFAAQGSFEVVAIASPSRAAEVAKERGIPHAFASLEEMLANVELDVLSIASPPFDHHGAVLAALERGLHVLCEKPFALDVAQAEEMCAAAARAGTVCAIAHEFRYTPQRSAIRELIANGHLGALRALEVNWYGTFLRAAVRRPKSWWFERRCGGGITGAVLSHLIDHANWLARRDPLRATGYERTAVAWRDGPEGEPFASDVADGAFATIDYGAGLIATVCADATRAVESATVAVHGESRTVVASGNHMLALTTFVVDEEETSELDLAPQPHANLAAAHPNLPPFVTMLDEFAKAIDGLPAELPTFAEGLATQRVLAAVGYGAPGP